MDYQEFLNNKTFLHQNCDYDGDVLPPDGMFDFQKDCLSWALRRGRSALFLDTGLGKTIIQLAWAYNIQDYTDKPVLIVAPLCVAQQTVREGQKFGIESTFMQEPGFSNARIHVTNYERLKNFDPSNYAGIVLDESSILKGMDGKLRKFITKFAECITYRLSCTATPSPNDFMEIGTQAEFLGIMSQVEMLAMFFTHDGSDTSKWRLKGHGQTKFWEWLSTWSIVLRHPRDLGYELAGYDLPSLNYHEHIVETAPTEGLFISVAQGLQERNKARRTSINARVNLAAEIANQYDEPVLVWCHLNDESEQLKSLIIDSEQVTGSMKTELKEKLLISFTDNDLQKLISKPKIAGFGMNWQHCNKIIFVGLSDSWESFYQAVRRCWRFGQTKEVDVHIISADTEGAVLENIKRKEAQNKVMGANMAKLMREFTINEISGATTEKADYFPIQEINLPKF